ncbi:MAG: cytidine deaminase [Bacteroidia bacterium]|jgi:cytidine deaminase|nr:cytidine deaminase [Bacteroidia bacterium]
MPAEKLMLEYLMLSGPDELSAGEQRLLEEAKGAALKAYAPYSNFRVGAAIMLEDGTIVTGNNQENAAYPSGLCAERVALFYASAVHPGMKVKALAVTAINSDGIIEQPVTPCGACRQVMAEYEKNSGIPMRIIMQGQTGPVMVVDSVSSLLPFTFVNDFLFNHKRKP